MFVRFLRFFMAPLLSLSSPALASKPVPSLDWVETRLESQEAPVGKSVRVFCEAWDSEGNKLSKATHRIVILPQRGLLHKKLSLTGLSPGTWEVSCRSSWRGVVVNDLTPASLLVLPQSPVRISAQIGSLARWIPSHKAFRVHTTLFDRFGHIVHPKAISFHVSPSSGVDVSRAPVFSFQRDGQYTISIKAKTGSTSLPYLKKTISVWVDGAGPVIRLNGPARGTTLSGEPIVRVWGNIKDAMSGLAFAKLNGKALEVDKDGEFSVWFPCRWGLNFLSLVAVDRAGRTSKSQQSFLYSPRYHPHSKRSINLVKKAFSVHLQQSFLDDLKRETLGDLASFLEFSLNQVSLDPLLPPQLVKGAYKVPPFGPTLRYVVRKNGRFQLGKRRLKLQLFRNKIWLWTRLENLRLPLDIQVGAVRVKPLVLAKYLSLSMWLHLKLEGNKGKVTIGQVFSDFRMLKIRGLTGVMGWLSGVLESQLRQRIQDALVKLLKDRIGPLLEQTLKRAKFDREWRLPPLFGGQKVRLLSNFQQILIRKTGLSLELSVGLSFSKRQKGRLSGAIIAPQREFHWPKASVGVALSVDLFNYVFHAVWAGGLMNLDLTPYIARELTRLPALPFTLPNPTARIEALLPPVLMPGNKAYPVALGLGDISISLMLPNPGGRAFELQAYVSLLLGFRLVHRGDDLLFEIAPKPLNVHIDIRRIRGSSHVSRAQLSLFLEELVNRAMPQILSQALPRFRIPKLIFPQIDQKALMQQIALNQKQANQSKKRRQLDAKTLKQLEGLSKKTIEALQKIRVTPQISVFDGTTFVVSFQVK